MTIELLTCIFSLAAMIAAVASPIIVAWINNRYQAKKESRDFYEKHRCEVIECYLQNTARFLYDNTPQNESSRDYGSALAEIYMYTPEALWPAIDEMNELALAWYSADDHPSRTYYSGQAKSKYRELCKSFSDFARSPKSKKKYRHAQKK